MRRTEGSTKATRVRQNRLFITLLALAVLSSVVKDLNRLHSWASVLLGDSVPSAHASDLSLAERSCPKTRSQAPEPTDQFRWVGNVAPGQSIEVKGISGDIDAVAALGGGVEVTATKKARQSDPAAVNFRVLEHARGVTICAVYPTDEPGVQTPCEAGRGDTGRNRSATINVRNNDVHVNFAVRVPAGVEFIGRTINGEISAKSLDGNVDTNTVNGSINVSTSGFARAKTVNGEINAKLGDVNWPEALEFKTINGGIDLDLPAALSTRLEAATFNGEVVSDFPLTVLRSFGRKRISGTIGAGGRDLVLKTLNGSIRVRRAS